MFSCGVTMEKKREKRAKAMLYPIHEKAASGTHIRGSSRKGKRSKEDRNKMTDIILFVGRLQ